MPDDRRRDYGPQGCAERGVLLLTAVVLAACAACNLGPQSDGPRPGPTPQPPAAVTR